MSFHTDEPDDRTLETEAPPAAPPSEWRRPLLLAGIGLVLMLGGYAAMNYVPLSPQQAEQERRFDELRTLAGRSSAGGSEAESLNERLKQVAPPWRNPPYRMPGRLAIYLGLFLFIAAGFLMYRKSPAPKTDEME